MRGYIKKLMKSFRELKSEARASLRGKWGEAVLATFVLTVFIVLAEAPSTFAGLTSFTHRFQSYVLQGNMEAAWSLLGRASAWSGSAMLIFIFVLGPVNIGFSNSFRLLLDGDKNLIDNMFKAGFGKYLHNVLGNFLVGLYISLWSLLFIVPGIIKAFSYAMTPYILVEYPELSVNEAIDKSRELMRGNKWRLFLLGLSFIGWILLCIPTFGIGTFWVGPYVETTIAAFYKDIKEQKSFA